MSSPEKIRVELDSKANTQGFDQMAEASKKVTTGTKSAAEAAYDAGEKTKGMARGLGEGAAAGNAAVSAMAQLSTASKGGAEGMMAIARAGFAAGVSLKAVMASMGPFGIAAAAIGIAMGVVSLAFRKAEKDAEEVKKKIGELNKLNLEAIKTQLDNITTAAKEGADALTEEAAVADRFADAKLARDKLALEVEAKDSGMSAEEKSKRMLKLERDREDQRINQTKETKERIAKIEEDAAADLAQKQLDADAKLNQARAARPEYEQLKKRERELMQRAGTFDPEIEDAAAAELQTARSRLKYLEKKLPEIEARIPGLEEEKAKADSVSLEQAKTAKKARGAADAYTSEQAGLAPLRDQRRGLEDKRDATKIPLTPAQQAAQDRSDQFARMTFPDEYRQRIASGANVDIGQLRRIYPGVKWPEAIDQSPSAIAAVAPSQSPSSAIVQRGGGSLPGDGAPKDDRIQIDAKPLSKGLTDSAAKLKAELDKQLAQIANTAAAQSVALTATAAAASTLAAKQAQTDAAVAQLQSQVANMRP